MTAGRRLDVSAVAKRVGVSCQTIRNWIARGLLDAERTPTGRYQIAAASVDTILTRTKSQKSQSSQA